MKYTSHTSGRRSITPSSYPLTGLGQSLLYWPSTKRTGTPADANRALRTTLSETIAMTTQTTNTTTVPATLEVSFFFRALRFEGPSLPKVLEANAEDRAHKVANPSLWELVTYEAGGNSGLTGYKRKSVCLQLPNPALWLAPLQASLQPVEFEYLVEAVAASQFRTAKALVDAYKPEHEIIEACALSALAAAAAAARAARPRAASVPQFADEVLAKVQALFSAFYGAVAPKFAPRVAELVTKAWSFKAIEKTLGEVTETRAQNLMARVAQFLDLVQADTETPADTKAELVPVLQAGITQLDRFIASKFGNELAADDEM